MTQEARLRQLSRESQLAKSAHESSQKEAGERVREVEQLEKKLRDREWEMKDALSAQDARIAELEGLLEQSEGRAKNLREEFERRSVQEAGW